MEFFEFEIIKNALVIYFRIIDMFTLTVRGLTLDK